MPWRYPQGGYPPGVYPQGGFRPLQEGTLPSRRAPCPPAGYPPLQRVHSPPGEYLPCRRVSSKRAPSRRVNITPAIADRSEGVPCGGGPLWVSPREAPGAPGEAPRRPQGATPPKKAFPHRNLPIWGAVQSQSKKKNNKKREINTTEEEERGDRNRPPTRPHAQELTRIRVSGNPSLRHVMRMC